MRRPNLFIVGAPKCGTSSLHNYLDQHPDIFMSRPTKEPAWFCTDLQVNKFRRPRDLQAYLTLFDGARDEKWLGESTTWNLYSKVAAENIKKWDPAAKIIIMLRNPVDAMYSLHGQFLWSCNEDITDFEEALRAQADRRQGRRIPAEAHSPDGLQYSEVFTFAPQVKRYLDAFGRENVKVIIFNEFVKETARIYRETLEFLGVDPNFQATLEVVNAAKPVAMGFNRFFGQRPGLRNWVNRYVPVGFKQKLMDVVPHVFPTIKREKKIDPELRKRLLPTVEKDVKELGELIGRDLGRWLRGE
ncbi:MAG: sulfotransferase family protein [Bacillota bacterium]